MRGFANRTLPMTPIAIADHRGRIMWVCRPFTHRLPDVIVLGMTGVANKCARLRVGEPDKKTHNILLPR